MGFARLSRWRRRSLGRDRLWARDSRSMAASFAASRTGSVGATTTPVRRRSSPPRPSTCAASSKTSASSATATCSQRSHKPPLRMPISKRSTPSSRTANGRAGRTLIHVILRRRGLAPTFVRAHLARLGELASAASQTRPSTALDALPGAPMITVQSGAALIGRSLQAVNEAIPRLVDARRAHPDDGRKRNRAFEAKELIDSFTALERQLASPDGDTRSPPPVAAFPRDDPSARRRCFPAASREPYLTDSTRRPHSLPWRIKRATPAFPSRGGRSRRWAGPRHRRRPGPARPVHGCRYCPATRSRVVT